MQRYKMTVEYDGRPFLGWQTQPEKQGVQDYIEQALYNLLKIPVKIFCAGRTDTGVHGAGQVIHCDIPDGFRVTSTEYKFLEGLNYYLKPAPISILKIEKKEFDFHARFSALKRHYRYKILNRRAMPTFREGLVWHVRKELNLDIMKYAAQDFIGTHDFTTFRSSDCQSPSAIRTMDNVFLEHYHDELHFCVQAKSFLQHQIRSMVGTLVKIGMAQLPPDYVKTALATKRRDVCGPVAPPYGLYFEDVIYE